jgi:hypothetical protein
VSVNNALLACTLFKRSGRCPLVEDHSPAFGRQLPHGRAIGVTLKSAVGGNPRRAICEQRRALGKRLQCEVLRPGCGSRRGSDQQLHNLGAVVRAAGPAKLAEVRVKKLLDLPSISTYARLMQCYFKNSKRL